MKGIFFLLAVICATLSSSFGQSFNAANPTLFLVNRTSSAPDASGVVTTTSALETIGANNEAGGNGSANYYDGTGSPSTTVVPNPCSFPTTNTKCSASASCVTSPSNPVIYQCICNSGFNDTSTTTVDPSTLVQPGTTCLDMDECLTNATVCGDGQDTCNNTAGSYFCTCLTGYSVSSDSFSCNYIDECTTSNPCHTNATCNRTDDGSADCTCNPPFVGDGINNCIQGIYNYSYRAELIAVGITSATQTDTDTAVRAIFEEYKAADPLSTFAYNSITITQERATPQGANVNIIVSISFYQFTRSADELTQIMNNTPLSTAYGASTALTITDYDECPTNYANCSTKANTTCTNTNGSSSCECGSKFYDNSTALGQGNGMECVDPYSYDCDGTRSTLNLVVPFFENVNVNVTTLAINTNCTGVTSGEFHIFTDCNGTVSNNLTTLISAFNVLTDESLLSAFIVGQTVNFTYYCTHPKSQNVTDDNAPSFVADTNNFVPVPNDIFSDSTQAVDFAVVKFKDDFSNQLSGPQTVKTGDTACIEVSASNIGSGVTIQFETVWTGSPGFSTSTSDYLTLVNNFCPASNNGIITAVQPGGKICFTMHRPSNGYELQVVLKVELCVGSDCTNPTCPASRRRRRDIADVGKKVRTETISTVFIIAPDDQCSKYCGTGACVYDADKNEQCVCYQDTYKKDNGVCYEQYNGSSSLTTLIIIISVAGFILIGIAAFTAFHLLRRKNANRTKDFENSYDNTAYKS